MLYEPYISREVSQNIVDGDLVPNYLVSGLLFCQLGEALV